MDALNKSQLYVISKFLQRYDYDAVLEVLTEHGIDSGDLYNLLESCKYAVNFDFKSSLKFFDKLSENKLNRKEMQEARINLVSLIEGESDAILSELIENMRIQVVNEEYIDFLGRLYRLKEALFKYIFVNTKENKTYKISMHGNLVSKRNILYTLKKRYNIYNSNLIHGVTSYVKKHVRSTKRMDKVLEILNGEKIENLMKLRNDSPVGHGFRGVSREDIEEIYGEPMEVLQDLIKVCDFLDLGVSMGKYDDLNDTIIEMIASYS